MSILDPGPIIAYMREQSRRDLAVLALVASMADSEEEAIERLNEIYETMKEFNKTIDRRKERHLKRDQIAIVDGVLEMAPKIARMIRQMLDVAERKAA